MYILIILFLLSDFQSFIRILLNFSEMDQNYTCKLYYTMCDYTNRMITMSKMLMYLEDQCTRRFLSIFQTELFQLHSLRSNHIYGISSINLY